MCLAARLTLIKYVLLICTSFCELMMICYFSSFLRQYLDQLMMFIKFTHTSTYLDVHFPICEGFSIHLIPHLAISMYSCFL